jgi:hypothetical protein
MPERDEHVHEQFEEAELSRMLAWIDHPVASLRASEIIGRERARSGRRSVLLAAAALILVASVATATVPGWVVQGYLNRFFDGRPSAPAPPQAESAAAADAASRGIAFAAEAQVDVDFRAEQSSGALQIRWADVPSVMLSQTGSSGDAHYSLTPGGVIVSNGGSTASYTLVIPRAVTRARVRIAGRVVFAKEADSVSCTGIRVDTGSCVIEVAAEHAGASKRTSR